MNLYSLPPLITFVINFSIALIILFDNIKDTKNRWFAAFIIMFSLWNLSEVILLNSDNKSNALFAAQILYRIIFITPAFFVIIAHIFPQNFLRYSKKFIFILSVFLIPILTLFLSYPNFQIQIIPIKSLHNVFYYQIIYLFKLKFLVLLFVSLLYIVWGSYTLYSKIDRLKLIREKNQVRFLLYGFLTIVLGYLVINVFRAEIKQFFHIPFYFLANGLSLLVSIFFLVALLRFQFLNNKTLKKGIIYFFFFTLVLAIYLMFVIGFGKTLKHYFGINADFFNASVLMILVFLIRPVETKIHSWIDRTGEKDIYRYRHNFNKFNSRIREYLPHDRFFDLIFNFLKDNYDTSEVLTFTFSPETEEYIQINSQNTLPLSIKSTCYLINELSKFKNPFELYSLDFKKIDKDIIQQLKTKNIRLILYLRIDNKIQALLMLSTKKGDKNYSATELEQLSIFTNDITLAYQRNLMIEKLQREAAEKFQMEKLASLGQLTAGIAHEIRNPLNTISLSVQTLTAGNAGGDEQKELLQYISEEISRLEKLLNDFLKLSRIRKSETALVSVPDLFDRIVKNFEMENTQEISLMVENNLSRDQIISDFDALYQILLNLTKNAVDAITEKAGKVKDFTSADGQITIAAIETNSAYFFEVKNNGLEISEPQKSKIFEPFFTTKETGTGLGLAIVHNLVKMLNGKIIVDSNLYGTIFKLIFSKTETL